MKCLPVVAFVSASLLSSCANKSPAPVQTYADLEASMWQRLYAYRSSQLSDHPLRNPGWRDGQFALFFQLPLCERVVAIMTSFATVQTDGETGEMLSTMLRYRGDPEGSWQPQRDGFLPLYKPMPEDQAYTHAIFRTIDRYGEKKIRRFCQAVGNGDGEKSYALFQTNLKNWKQWCDYHQ